MHAVTSYVYVYPAQGPFHPPSRNLEDRSGADVPQHFYTHAKPLGFSGRRASRRVPLSRDSLVDAV